MRCENSPAFQTKRVSTAKQNSCCNPLFRISTMGSDRLLTSGSFAWLLPSPSFKEQNLQGKVAFSSAGVPGYSGGSVTKLYRVPLSRPGSYKPSLLFIHSTGLLTIASSTFCLPSSDSAIDPSMTKRAFQNCSFTACTRKTLPRDRATINTAKTGVRPMPPRPSTINILVPAAGARRVKSKSDGICYGVAAVASDTLNGLYRFQITGPVAFGQVARNR